MLYKKFKSIRNITKKFLLALLALICYSLGNILTTADVLTQTDSFNVELISENELNKKFKTNKISIIDWKGLICKNNIGEKVYIWFDNNSYFKLEIDGYSIKKLEPAPYNFNGTKYINLGNCDNINQIKKQPISTEKFDLAYTVNNTTYHKLTGFKKNHVLLIYDSEDCSSYIGLIDNKPRFLSGAKKLSKGEYWASLIDLNNPEIVTNCEKNSFTQINGEKLIYFDLKSLINKSDNTITVVTSFVEEMREGGRSKKIITALKNIFETVHEKYDRDKLLYDINFLTIDKENKIDFFYSTAEIPELKREKKIVRELLKINGTNVIDFDKLWDNEVVKKAAKSEGGGLFFIVSNALDDSITRDKALDVIDNGAEFKVFQNEKCPEKKRFKNLCHEINTDSLEVFEETLIGLLSESKFKYSLNDIKKQIDNGNSEPTKKRKCKVLNRETLEYVTNDREETGICEVKLKLEEFIAPIVEEISNATKKNKI